MKALMTLGLVMAADSVLGQPLNDLKHFLMGTVLLAVIRKC